MYPRQGRGLFAADILRTEQHAHALATPGNSYASLDEHDLAIADDNLAIALEPNDPEAFSARGRCLDAQEGVRPLRSPTMIARSR